MPEEEEVEDLVNVQVGGGATELSQQTLYSIRWNRAQVPSFYPTRYAHEKNYQAHVHAATLK